MLTLLITGAGLLALAVVAGQVAPAAVLIGFLGGILSFTGVIAAAPWLMPATLAAVGRSLGSSLPARMAAQNALRTPERSARTTIGLVIGVTLITTFTVTAQTCQDFIAAARNEPSRYAGSDPALTMIMTIFSVLVGVSAVSAAIGMANNLSVSVMQRSREIGLLRALGVSVNQLRWMIRAESIGLATSSVLIGLLLGIGYGWVAAQSMLGGMHSSPGFIPPGIPWPVIAVIAAATAVLAWASSAMPARRATRVPPVSALNLD